MPEILLPLETGLTTVRIERACPYSRRSKPLKSRIAYAAGHVVPKGDGIDWGKTLAFRRHLWSYGLGVAEAMDTAQRGMGLDWEMARELITRSLAEAQGSLPSEEWPRLIACGAGTDQLSGDATLGQIIAAYEEQCEWIEAHGGRVILMASRALARTAKSPDDYRRVYTRILSQLRQPVILHWLGEMFDPQLAGYWASPNLDQAMETCLALIRDHTAKIDGIKISLLDAQREIDMRRRLPEGVHMYTGDDFHYDTLIRGGSHALLGIFDPIAPAASAAIQALDAGDPQEFDRILAPTIPLSRLIFESPTYLYKTGVVFLAWLNGHQDEFRMLGGCESARSLTHLATLLVLAEQAGVLEDPDLASHRMQHLLHRAGVAAR